MRRVRVWFLTLAVYMYLGSYTRVQYIYVHTAFCWRDQRVLEGDS
jgi:hypothetical protein